MMRRAAIAAAITLALAAGSGTASPQPVGGTSVVSVASAGAQSNGDSRGGVISDDGSVVAFVSDASNLVQNDANNGADVFVFERATHAMELVSLSSSNQQVADGQFTDLDVSPDGRFVVFSSPNSFVPEDTGPTWDVYLRDRSTGTTELVSVAVGGGGGNGASWDPSISADGTHIAFTSVATNLVEEPLTGFTAVYVRDRQIASTTMVSRWSIAGIKGSPANHN